MDHASVIISYRPLIRNRANKWDQSHMKECSTRCQPGQAMSLQMLPGLFKDMSLNRITLKSAKPTYGNLTELQTTALRLKVHFKIKINLMMRGRITKRSTKCNLRSIVRGSSEVIHLAWTKNLPSTWRRSIRTSLLRMADLLVLSSRGKSPRTTAGEEIPLQSTLMKPAIIMNRGNPDGLQAKALKGQRFSTITNK